MEPLTLAVLFVLFVATMTQSTFGFGNALFAMPLLSMLAGLEIARPLVALMSTTVAAGVVLHDWREIRLRQDWQLLLGSLAGIPLGFYAAELGPESIVKAVLAFVLIGFAWFRLRNPGGLHLTTSRSAPLFGFAAGILGGAYNTFGPPLVVYATLRRWEQQRFRATMQGLFVPIGGLILFFHWRAGAWTPVVVRYYLLGIPCVIVALWVGRHISRKLAVARFFAIVHGVLILLGVSLIVQVLMKQLQ